MFQNNNLLMYELRNTTVNKFGNDQTGLISYKFDEYGFREGNNYKNNPYITFFGNLLSFILINFPIIGIFSIHAVGVQS